MHNQGSPSANSSKNGDTPSKSDSPLLQNSTLSPAHIASSIPNTPTSMTSFVQNNIQKYTTQRSVLTYPSSLYSGQSNITSALMQNNNQHFSPNASALYYEMFSSQQGLGSGDTAIVKMEPPNTTHLPYPNEDAVSRSPSVDDGEEHEGHLNGSGLDVVKRQERPTVVSISG